jgi:6-pyruvoyltetrahydropterin/6-carboxytetrahydropterin synthase
MTSMADGIDRTAGDSMRHVTVEGVRLRFAAAHMATIGETLEPLHGHNYAVRCRVEGDLTPDGWVIDFSALKRAVREACERLDHRFLLQTRSPLLAITETAEGWVIEHQGSRYVFPMRDVAPLPIANTTAELLAEWLASAVHAALAGPEYDNIRRVFVDVEEMPGQTAGFVVTRIRR